MKIEDPKHNRDKVKLSKELYNDICDILSFFYYALNKIVIKRNSPISDLIIKKEEINDFYFLIDEDQEIIVSQLKFDELRSYLSYTYFIFKDLSAEEIDSLSESHIYEKYNKLFTFLEINNINLDENKFKESYYFKSEFNNIRNQLIIFIGACAVQLFRYFDNKVSMGEKYIILLIIVFFFIFIIFFIVDIITIMKFKKIKKNKLLGLILSIFFGIAILILSLLFSQFQYLLVFLILLIIYIIDVIRKKILINNKKV